MNYAEIKLGELLSSDNPAIKRNATGILRQLQKEKEKHKLTILSLHDSQAECSCGWHYCFTGEKTKEEIENVWRKHF